MPIPPQTQILPRTTAKERVYQTLRQWIINGTLQPRERLNDVELARYFSVSRTPVREALQRLSEKKLVQIVPSSGTYVAPIDDQDMAHVYQLLVALQSLALELCIRTITPDQLERLEEEDGYDVDVLLLYSPGDDPAAVSRLAGELREEGRSVRLGRSAPPGLRCRETLRFGEGGGRSWTC